MDTSSVDTISPISTKISYRQQPYTAATDTIDDVASDEHRATTKELSKPLAADTNAKSACPLQRDEGCRSKTGGANIVVPRISAVKPVFWLVDPS
jgi:hypothetical protein